MHPAMNFMWSTLVFMRKGQRGMQHLVNAQKGMYPRGWKRGGSVEEQSVLQTGGGCGGETSGGGGGGDDGRQWYRWALLGLGLAAVFYSTGETETPGMKNENSARQGPRQVSFEEFSRAYLEKKIVNRIVVVNKSEARVFVKQPAGASPVPYGHSRPVATFVVPDVDVFERRLEKAQRENDVDPLDFVPVVYTTETSMLATLVSWSPSLLLIGLYFYISRRMGGAGGLGSRGGGIPFGGSSRPPGGASGPGGIFSVGKASVTVLNKDSKNKVTTTFADVAGLDEAKAEIMEFVSYLKSPERYRKIGAKIPKGALMYGPPGTGKTLLAKATAGESEVPFLTLSGSDFMELFVGVGPSRVRDLFSQARQLAPCIVFIDEIDAIGRARGRGGMIGGNDERENTLNQLLVEMDGFAPNSGVVVFAGTNRMDVLDPALLRPGRFDRQISIDPPDIKGRYQIYLVHLKPVKLAKDAVQEDIAKDLAAQTPGFTGADIANVCNEAALIAARFNAPGVCKEHFEAAVDRVIGGIEKKSMIMP